MAMLTASPPGTYRPLSAAAAGEAGATAPHFPHCAEFMKGSLTLLINPAYATDDQSTYSSPRMRADQN
jgi:hypothetical protein